jgi:hypothetical protein
MDKYLTKIVPLIIIMMMMMMMIIIIIMAFVSGNYNIISCIPSP